MERSQTFAINNGATQSAGGVSSAAADDDDDELAGSFSDWLAEPPYWPDLDGWASQIFFGGASPDEFFGRASSQDEVQPQAQPQQRQVDFETVLDLAFGGGGGAGSYGGGGALPASSGAAVVAGLEKKAFHAATEGRPDSGSECGGGGGTGCAICLESFDDGEEVTVMPCSGGHEFHAGCITKWLGKSNTCPLCRHALPTHTSTSSMDDVDD